MLFIDKLYERMDERPNEFMDENKNYEKLNINIQSLIG